MYQYKAYLDLNLPDAPYTSLRVLHGVCVEMAKRKSWEKKNEKEKNSKKEKYNFHLSSITCIPCVFQMSMSVS